jgi:hypothetical protein
MVDELVVSSYLKDAPFTCKSAVGLVVPIPIFVPLSKTLLLVIVEDESNLTK